MTDLRARLKPLFRRSSTFSSTKSSASDSSPSSPTSDGRSWSKSSLRLSKTRRSPLPLPISENKELLPPISPTTPLDLSSRGGEHSPATSPETPRTPPLQKEKPTVTLEAPTPTPKASPAKRAVKEQDTQGPERLIAPIARDSAATQRSATTSKGQSPAAHNQPHIVTEGPTPDSPLLQSTKSDFVGPPRGTTKMQRKKIWVKRPGSSATQVMINEEDLVDDVRDMILKKYANSLGRSFDSPDVTLRIIFRHPSGRHSQTERTLGPEEAVSKILEMYYPGGQAVEEALIIDVPQKRSPKHSPHLAMPYYLNEDLRPRENGTDYFPPMPPQGQRSPHLPNNLSVSSASGATHHPPPHSISIINTGQLPNLPSPGARTARHSQHNQHRPKYGRQHTSSPTIISGMTNGSQNHGELNHPPDDEKRRC